MTYRNDVFLTRAEKFCFRRIVAFFRKPKKKMRKKEGGVGEKRSSPLMAFP